MKAAWFVIWFAVAYALTCWVYSVAYGAEPLDTWTLAALRRAAPKADQPEAFARHIARFSEHAPLPPRKWAALLIAIGTHESRFSPDIVANRCKPWQCDRGRARGAFQVHRLGYLAGLWDISPGDPAVQVEMADRVLRRSLTRCAPFASFPALVYRAYRGGSCSWPIKGEAARVATYMRAMR
jgi:hypothetical protein